MPVNELPLNVRSRPPKGPPKLSNRVIPDTPPPLPKTLPKKSPNASKGKTSKVRTFLEGLGLCLGIGVFVWAFATGFLIQAENVKAWAKDYDYRHCIGKFDTPGCHEKKARSNKEAYENYRGSQ